MLPFANYVERWGGLRVRTTPDGTRDGNRDSNGPGKGL
jgi:hypothetical protein